MTSQSALEPTEHDPTVRALLQDAAPALLQFARRLCGQPADAADIVQETLARAWRLRASFDPAGNGAAWLRTIAFRVHCDQRAQRQRQPTLPEPDGHPARADGDRVALRDELQHSLKSLTGIERAVLLGFHRDGHSLERLAQQHAMPVNTVKSHLHRARRRLRPLTDTDPS